MWPVIIRGNANPHQARIAAFKRAVWRTFKPAYDPMADGMLTAYHNQQATEHAIKTELQQLLGKRYA